jgi:hypothetical protein
LGNLGIRSPALVNNQESCSSRLCRVMKAAGHEPGKSVSFHSAELLQLGPQMPGFVAVSL